MSFAHTQPPPGIALRLCRDSTRAEIESAIEKLIGHLDKFEGDPDCEPEEDACEFEDARPNRYAEPAGGDPDDAEPTWRETGAGAQVTASMSPRAADDDIEPTSPETGEGSQFAARLSARAGDDDSEPSLGWGAGAMGAIGATDDRERDR
jgi:hypothetical protein